MAKEERGTKRVCQSCGAKFYDLNRDPITCPVCSAPFVLEPLKTAAEEKPEAADEPTATAAAEDNPAPASSAAEPELVSLDEAAAEEEAVEDADLVDIDDDEEAIPPGDDEDVFLEEDEDDPDSDVTGIIGSPIDSKDEA